MTTLLHVMLVLDNSRRSCQPLVEVSSEAPIAGCADFMIPSRGEVDAEPCQEKMKI
jgi:hypothetical protein